MICGLTLWWVFEDSSKDAVRSRWSQIQADDSTDSEVRETQEQIHIMAIPFGRRFSFLSACGHKFPNPSLEVDLQFTILMRDVSSSSEQTMRMISWILRLINNSPFDEAVSSERSDSDSRLSRQLLSRGRKHTHRYTGEDRYWASPSYTLSNKYSSSPLFSFRKAASDSARLRQSRSNESAEWAPLAHVLTRRFLRQTPVPRILRQAWIYKMVLPLPHRSVLFRAVLEKVANI